MHYKELGNSLKHLCIFFLRTKAIMTDSMKRNKSVLITGGAGYIGSHLSVLLQEQGYQVTIFDNLSTGNAGLVSGSDLITGDTLDTATLVDVMKNHQISSVVHLAAKSSVPESFANPEIYYKTNAHGTKSVIEACTKAGVQHLLFSSTAAVYGNATHGLVSENAPVKPISPYGESKLKAEQLVSTLCARHGINQITFRYFNVIGAHPKGQLGQYNPKSEHLLQNCLNAIRNNTMLEIYGNDYDTPDGSAERDFIHVQDLASLHLHALHYLESDGESLLLNAGYGTAHSVLEFIETFQNVTGKAIQIDQALRRNGDPTSLIADVSRLNQKLDWTPQFSSLEQMIGSSWQWENSPSRKAMG